MEVAVDNTKYTMKEADKKTDNIFNDIEDVLSDFAEGKMVIMLDDEDRENEGDLLIAAEKITAKDINFMAKYGRGLICLTLTEEKCQQLKLPLMVTNNNNNNAPFGTRFTVSIEAAVGVTTGISASDRATTIKACIKKDATCNDIVQPGHIFPIMAQEGGVLTRAGHTEAGCDLAKLSGFDTEASVLVEILNEDGSMARRDDLFIFAKEHNLKLGTIADLIRYKLQNEKTIELVSSQSWQTKYGKFKLLCYVDYISEMMHYALVKGEINNSSTPYVRVHVENKITDILHHKIDKDKDITSGWPLDKSIKFIAEQGNGVIVILSNDQNDNEILNIINNKDIDNTKTKTDDQKKLRRIGIGSQILNDIGINKMKLLSDPVKYYGLSGFDLTVEQFIKYENV